MFEVGWKGYKLQTVDACVGCPLQYEVTNTIATHPAIDMVLEYEFGGNAVEHLHRIGRTGRWRRPRAEAVTFYSPMHKDLINVIRTSADEENKSLEAAFSRRRGFRKRVNREKLAWNLK